MAPVFKVTDEVREVLERSEITDTTVSLPEQLERKLYDQVKKALNACGGKWDRKAQTHVFARDPREALGLVIETGEAVNHKQLNQSFYTPPEIVAKVLEAADIQWNDRVLEPSAGEGALAFPAQALTRRPVVAIERDPPTFWELVGLTHDELNEWPIVCVMGCDFLDLAPCPIYDVVVMNPPFTKGQDIEHVTHAIKFLAPEGRLVAIMPPAWVKSSGKKQKAFRDVLDNLGNWETETLPDGAFKSAGTNVRTIMLSFERNEDDDDEDGLNYGTE